MIKAIKFASIPVRDQDRALEFYTKKLGFRVITDSPFDGTQRSIKLGLPRAERNWCCSPHRAGADDRRIHERHLHGRRLEATASEMKALNVSSSSRDAQKADWGTAAILKDMDGNPFVLSTP